MWFGYFEEPGESIRRLFPGKLSDIIQLPGHDKDILRVQWNLIVEIKIGFTLLR